MEPTADDLAGVVDLFGGLTRAELQDALSELAFKRGETLDEDEADALIEDARRSYHLVAVEDTDATTADEPVLVPGPTAFSTLPDGAEDLPHILDGAGQSVEDDARLTAVERRFRADAATAIDEGDGERIAELLDVSYELEVWGDVDLESARERLDDAAE